MIPVYFSKPSVLCAAGSSPDELWNSVISGNQNGLKRVKALNGKEFWAGRIDDNLLSEKSSSRYDMRIIRIEEKCLSGIEDEIFRALEKYGPEKTGVCVGSCDNGTEFSVAGHRKFFADGKFDSTYSLEIQGADYVATFISEKYGIKGPSLTFSTACSSSAGAIIKAAELIQSGICDAVICGGVDIASDTVLMGFDALEAVSSEKTNPFSANRHGITLGEAAAFFVLSRENIWDEEKPVKLSGYGESADAYHMTSPDPSGNGAFAAINKSISLDQLKQEKIDYINLHGTGTKYNDSMEAKAIDRIFGKTKVPCSTTKTLTGHTLGAAGALEAAVCWLTLTKNKGNSNPSYPVQIWDGVQDPAMPPLNITGKNFTKSGEIHNCLSNSFAFGGANSCLILSL